jgi:hypothetical protein
MARQRPALARPPAARCRSGARVAPDHAALKRLAKVGVVGAHPAGSACAFELRAFASMAGIDEDPVTGSLNAGVAEWLIGSGRAPGALRRGAGREARPRRQGPRLPRERALLDRRRERQLRPRRGPPVSDGAPLAIAPDHVVVAAKSSRKARRGARTTLGARPVEGGRHANMGTHNRLLGLADAAHRRMYLEIIAVDPAAPPPERARWFDLDSPRCSAALAAGPRLVHWVARCNDLDRAIAAAARRGPRPRRGDRRGTDDRARLAPLAHLVARRRRPAGGGRGAAADRMGRCASCGPPAAERRLGRGDRPRGVDRRRCRVASARRARRSGLAAPYGLARLRRAVRVELVAA